MINDTGYCMLCTKIMERKILTSLVTGVVNLPHEDRLSATELSYWQF